MVLERVSVGTRCADRHEPRRDHDTELRCGHREPHGVIEHAVDARRDVTRVEASTAAAAITQSMRVSRC
jgi:hypothetical protein